jgi:hypothetical protein
MNEGRSIAIETGRDKDTREMSNQNSWRTGNAKAPKARNVIAWANGPGIRRVNSIER